MNIKDLTGYRSDMITVLSKTEKRSKKGCIIWKCACECGNIVFLSSEQIQHNKSCGCRKQKTKDDFAAQKQLTFIDGTCVEWIRNRKHRSDNTSGFRGVSWMKKHRKWSAYIGFKGKRCNLGYYDSFEEAVQARLKAEEEIYKPFLEAYYTKRKT